MHHRLVFLACLAGALAVTDAAMRANLHARPAFTFSGGRPVPDRGQAGAAYVRLDGGLAADFVVPALLQGALATCACALLFVGAAAAVTAAAAVKVAATDFALLASTSDPAVAGRVAAVARRGDVQRLSNAELADAIREQAVARNRTLLSRGADAVFRNACASADVLAKTSAAAFAATCLAAGAAAIAAAAAPAALARRRLLLRHGGAWYASRAALARVSTACTWSPMALVLAGAAANTRAASVALEWAGVRWSNARGLIEL